MKKITSKSLFLTILLMLIFIIIIFLSMNACASGDTIYVDDDGGADYTCIQEAINSASNGDTVYVYGGTYYENVLLNKTIDLVGEDKNTTIIDGGSGDVVLIFNEWVNVSGFTIQNGDNGVKITYRCAPVGDNSYVYFQSDNNTVSNCIMNNKKNELIIDGTSNNQIIGNDIGSDELSRGIKIHGSNSNNNLIKNNHIHGPAILHEGIVIEGGHNHILLKNEIDNASIFLDSNYNLFQDNILINPGFEPGLNSGNGGGIHVSGDHNQIIENHFQGLGLDEAFDNLVQDNYIHDTDSGIFIEFSKNNIFMNNIISDCIHGISGYGLNGSHFENNTISNTVLVSMRFSEYAYNLKLINNVMDNGITTKQGFEGNIIIGNTVNGEPLIYKEDESHITIDDEPAGQIILVNCDNITINNVDLSDVIVGLEMIDSKNCSISNATFSTSIMGIHLIDSHYNLIRDNILSDMHKNNWWNEQPITIFYSNNNIIENNQLYDNWRGIGINTLSYNNQIRGNTISTDGGKNEGVGIYLDDRPANTYISYNTISDCNTGIQIGYVKGGHVYNTTIYMNTFQNCLYDIADYSTSTPPQTSSLKQTKVLSYKDKPTRILKNNFMGLNIFTKFKILDSSASFTDWNNNYWGRFKILPKLLFGIDKNGIPSQLKIDWDPAKRPYDI